MKYQHVRPIDDRWELIVEALDFTPATAIDLGASEGDLAVRLAAKYGTRVLALESKGVGQSHPLVEWRIGRFRSAEIAAMDKVDAVFALSVLHHFRDWAATWWAINGISDWLVVEIPNPSEGGKTKRSSELVWIDDLIRSMSPRLIGEARGWKTSLPRPMYMLQASAPSGLKGIVKAGRGKTAQQLPRVPNLAMHLGYQPYPGSLGMDLVEAFRYDGRDEIKVDSPYGEYLFTPARISGLRCHVMRPPRAKNRAGTAEVVAPLKLRTVLNLADGDTVWLA